MWNKPILNHGLGIFWCGHIWPWDPPSRSNEGSQIKSAYNLIIIGPRGLQCETNSIGNQELGIFWCDQVWPWDPPSRSNEESQIESAYNSIIIGPRGLQCETNL